MAPSEDDCYVAYIGSGNTGATVADTITTEASVRCVIIIIGEPHSSTDVFIDGRGYGKTLTSAEYVISSVAHSEIYIPRFRHDYPMLRRYFRGPIKRSDTRIRSIRLNLKVNCGSRDRVVNKRKSYIKQIQNKIK